MNLFKSLLVEWRQLLSLSSKDSIFLTWEWLYTWSEYYLGGDRSLHIVLVYRGKELVGIAPWYLSKEKFGPFIVKRLEFIGSPETGSDYLDVITRRGDEENVASVVYDYLFHDSTAEWNVLFFRDVPSNSLYFMNFLNLLGKKGKFFGIKKGSFCPHLILPSNKESFYTTLSANRRQQHKRHFRILNENVTLTHITNEGSESETLLAEIRKLYDKRWGGGHDLFFQFLEAFIERTKSAGTVQIDLLRSDDQSIAGIIHFNYKENQYMYLMAVDTQYNKKISAGNVFLGMCIQNAIEKKVTVYDFLKGGEPYKFHWANAGNSSLNICCYRNRLAPVFSYSIDCVRNIGKIVFR